MIQPGYNQHELSSDEESANDSSFERIDLDSDDEVVDKETVVDKGEDVLAALEKDQKAVDDDHTDDVLAALEQQRYQQLLQQAQARELQVQQRLLQQQLQLQQQNAANEDDRQHGGDGDQEMIKMDMEEKVEDDSRSGGEERQKETNEDDSQVEWKEEKVKVEKEREKVVGHLGDEKTDEKMEEDYDRCDRSDGECEGELNGGEEEQRKMEMNKEEVERIIRWYEKNEKMVEKKKDEESDGELVEMKELNSEDDFSGDEMEYGEMEMDISEEEDEDKYDIPEMDTEDVHEEGMDDEELPDLDVTQHSETEEEREMDRLEEKKKEKKKVTMKEILNTIVFIFYLCLFTGGLVRVLRPSSTVSKTDDVAYSGMITLPLEVVQQLRMESEEWKMKVEQLTKELGEKNKQPRVANPSDAKLNSDQLLMRKEFEVKLDQLQAELQQKEELVSILHANQKVILFWLKEAEKRTEQLENEQYQNKSSMEALMNDLATAVNRNVRLETERNHYSHENLQLLNRMSEKSKLMATEVERRKTAEKNLETTRVANEVLEGKLAKEQKATLRNEEEQLPSSGYPSANDDAADMKKMRDALVVFAANLNGKLNEQVSVKEFFSRLTWPHVLYLTVGSILIVLMLKAVYADAAPPNATPIRRVYLSKNANGEFGFALKGRFVTKVTENGAAAGHLVAGDEIIAVDRVNVETASVASIRLMISEKQNVTLFVRFNSYRGK